MNTPRLPLWLALAAPTLCLLATACSPSVKSTASWHPPQPVRIEGGEEWMNHFASWPPWITAAPTHATAGLLLRDGDWVIEKNGAPFVYRTTDGHALKLSVERQFVRLAGRVVGVSLDKETSATAHSKNVSGKEAELGRDTESRARAWLETAPTEELRGVRMVTMPEEWDPAWLPGLRRLAAANPEVAISAESAAAFRPITQLFRPRALRLGALDAEGGDLFANHPQVEILMVGDGSAPRLDFLGRLPRLRRLLLTEWDIKKQGGLPPGLTNLKALHVFNVKLPDPAVLPGLPPGIEELSLTVDKGSIDLQSVTNLPRLKALFLNGSEALPGLAALDGLRELQWVGLPAKITQEQFAAFVAAHRKIRVLELIACDGVTDLTPLRQLPELEGLVLAAGDRSAPTLVTSPQNAAALRSLKSLRFVGLPADAFTDAPAQVAEIRQALPDALVVPTMPFCLGSGWILLLVPVMVLAAVSRRWRRDTPPVSPRV